MEEEDLIDFSEGGSYNDDTNMQEEEEDEDYFNYGNDDDYYEDYDDQEESKEQHGNQNAVLACTQKNYKAITYERMVQDVKNNIENLSMETGASWGTSFKFFMQNQLDMGKTRQAMQNSHDQIYAEMDEMLVQMQNNEECVVCFETLDSSNRVGLQCCHYACRDCYHSYIIEQIKHLGQDIMFKTCIQDGCTQILGFDIYNTLGYSHKQVIDKLFINQIFGSNKQLYNPCPNPKCGFVLQNINANSIKNPNDSIEQNIVCVNCDYAFCNKCKKDAHQPVDCKLFEDWSKLIGGDTFEELNDMWLKINTKVCPKCKTNIEKNQGCRHMTCKQCKHEFCWLCMKDWRGHSGCNMYEEDENNKKNKMEEQKKLQKYQFYSERFIQYKKSIIEMQKQCKKSYNLIYNFLFDNKVIQNMQYLEEAIKVIIQGQMAITYSFIHCYYIDNKDKQDFLNFNITQLQNNNEKLYDKIVQHDYKEFIDYEINVLSKNYHDWHTLIIDTAGRVEKFVNQIVSANKQECENLIMQTKQKEAYKKLVEAQEEYNKKQKLQQQQGKKSGGLFSRFSSNNSNSNSQNTVQMNCYICHRDVELNSHGTCQPCYDEQQAILRSM